MNGVHCRPNAGWRRVGRALTAALALAAASTALPASGSDRAVFSGSFNVTMKTAAPRALSLFDPVGEAAWAPGWAPVFARESDRTALPDGAVFTTRGHEGGTTTWVLQRYDRRAGEIAYTVFDPEHAVVTIRIAVRERGPGNAEALVRYDLVATSEAGDRFVQEFGASFPHMRRHWQDALDTAIAHQT
jgi:hypothetical protein